MSSEVPRSRPQPERGPSAARATSAETPRVSLRERLAGRGGPILLDGATGTELERAGLPTGLPLWSTLALLAAPECVRDVHAAHLAAGAEIVTANTFRTQARTLARAGLPAADRSLTALAVGLARQAVAARSPRGGESGPDAGRRERRPSWVAGSLPPLEDCYRPERVPDEAALAREHGRQADLLGEAGVDLILVETMNSIREASAAARASARTGLPFVVSFVAWDGAALLSGEPLAEAARAVLDLGAAAVGVNCLPIANLEACRLALAGLEAPWIASPNLGQPEPNTGFTRDESVAAVEFVTAFDAWLDRPALILGGCCGTTPRHIAALAARLHGRPRPGVPPRA